MTICSVGFQSFEGRLTALIVTTEAAEQEADQQLLNQARADFVEESKNEVTAMHAAAEAMRDGAWTKLGVALVGAGVQGLAIAGQVEAFGPSACTSEWLTRLDKTGQAIAGQGPGIVGGFSDGEVGHHQADARAASYMADQAQWEIEDRNEAITNSRNDQNKATEWLSQSMSSDAATTNAILANMA